MNAYTKEDFNVLNEMIDITIDDFFEDINSRRLHFYFDPHNKKKQKWLFNPGELLEGAYYDTYIVDKVVKFLCKKNTDDIEKLRWLIVDAPFEKMPLFLINNEKYGLIAKWRLGIGK